MPLLRPGIGPRAGLSAARAAALRASPLGGGPGGLDGILDPGGGFDPPPPPQPINPEAFRVEIIDPRGTVQATTMGRLEFDLPETSPLPSVAGLTAGSLAAPFGPKWTLRITNTSRFRANVNVNLLFHGHRPILERDVDLDFLNEKLDLIFNVPQPFQIAFRNRQVATVRMNNVDVAITHTFVVLEASDAWRELHPDLASLEKDLGAHVFKEETGTYQITVKPTIHDGDLAFKADIAFPSFRGKIDVLNAIDALGHDIVAEIGDIIVGLTPADRPIISIRNFAFDVFMVLRPRGTYLRGGPTFEVITRPRIELEPSWAGIVVEALMQVAFERLLPEAASGPFRASAMDLLGWLLGDRGREVTGSDESLTLKYAGDAPSAGVLVLDTGSFNTTPGPLDPGNLSKIDHIVVVMLENRSFDHMLGFLSLPTSGNDGRIGLGRADVDGLRGNETNPRDTQGGRGRVFSLATPRGATPGLDPAHETRGTKFRFDPGHSYEATKAQRGDYDIALPPLQLAMRRASTPLDDFRFDLLPPLPPLPPREFHVGPNEGFIFDFARILSGQVSAFEEQLLRGEIMGYHPADHVPMYRFFAEQYAICDRWFASHPGHTWPNRFVSLTGRLAMGPDGLPQVNNPPLSSFDPLETATIFDHLTAAGVEWRYFEHDFCMLRLFSKYTFDAERVLTIDDPDRGFFTLARQGNLPPVTYIEPDLTDVPPGSDDHPPADIAAGQAFVKRVYDALVAGPAEQWRKTLLIVTYDEHGGFFDHVHPPSQRLFDASAPEQGGFAPIGVDPETREPIDHYGFRVPAFVVSPWVPAASVAHDEYDHTSILKTIMTRFMFAQPPDMGLRVLLAKDLGSLLSLNTPRAVLGGPRVNYLPSGLDAVAFQLGPPEEDFRAFLTAMRARLRAGAGSRRVSTVTVTMERPPP
jgi:phospholipase C